MSNVGGNLRNARGPVGSGAVRRFGMASVFVVALAAAATVAPGCAYAQGGQEDVQAPVKQFPKVVAEEVTTANGVVNGTLGRLAICAGASRGLPRIGRAYATARNSHHAAHRRAFMRTWCFATKAAAKTACI
jgi:hypothetical protein